MSRPTLLFAVDRIEGRMAVLVGEAGTTRDLELGRLPAGTREGSVVRVPTGPTGEPDWGAAVLDEAERRKRLDEAERILEYLKKRDPGGDVRL